MASNKSNRASLPSLTDLISFNLADISYSLKNKTLIREWIHRAITKEKKTVGDLAFNFCSDKYLLKINRQYLDHDFLTDIITFDLCEGKLISGDIYISIDRVRENARLYQTSVLRELHRVIIHGVLHLCGYKDKTRQQTKQMRAKEDYYLSLLP